MALDLNLNPSLASDAPARSREPSAQPDQTFMTFTALRRFIPRKLMGPLCGFLSLSCERLEKPGAYDLGGESVAAIARLLRYPRGPVFSPREAQRAMALKAVAAGLERQAARQAAGAAWLDAAEQIMAAAPDLETVYRTQVTLPALSATEAIVRAHRAQRSPGAHAAGVDRDISEAIAVNLPLYLQHALAAAVRATPAGAGAAASALAILLTDLASTTSEGEVTAFFAALEGQRDAERAEAESVKGALYLVRRDAYRRALARALGEAEQPAPGEAGAELTARFGWQVRERDALVAAAALHDAVVACPRRADFWAALGVTLAKAGQREQALEACQRSLALDADDIEVACIVAELALDLLRFDTAAAALERCLERDPSGDHPAGRRAFFLIKKGEQMASSAALRAGRQFFASSL